MGFAKERQLEVSTRGFGETDKAVCLACIHDESLRAETERHLDEWECSFCGATAEKDVDDPIAAPFEDFMYIVMGAVTFLYSTAANAGLVFDEGEWFGGPVTDSTDVAYSVCGGDVTDEVLEAIGDLIDDEEWTDSDISSLRPDQALRYGWTAFCDKVKYNSRFVFLATPEESSGRPDDITAAGILQKLETIISDYDLLRRVPAGPVFRRGRLTNDPSAVVE